jgi:Ca2+-binding EF-hand superfamily protein
VGSSSISSVNSSNRARRTMDCSLSDGHQSGSQTARAPSTTLAGLGPLTMPSVRPNSRSHARNNHRDGGSCEWGEPDAAIFEHIGQKAAQKFTTLREAFRFVDANKDGCVDRAEVRYFFRAYDLPDAAADRFFDRLAQGARAIDYQDFVRCMTPAIESGRPPSCGGSSDSQVSTREPSPRNAAAAVERQRAFEDEFRGVLDQIRLKALQRLGNARDLNRFIVGRDGLVSRSELQHMFRAFSVSQATADVFFDRLAELGSGLVEYEALMRLICPLLKDLPGVETLLPQPGSHSFLTPVPGVRSGPDATSAATERTWGRRRACSRGSAYCSTACGSAYCSSASGQNTSGSSPVPLDETERKEAERKEVERWGQCEAEAQAEELRMLVNDIRQKLPLKFRHAREAFRPLDVSRDGNITPTEMRSFVRGFGWSHDAADRLFTLLDTECRGEIGYGDFVKHFEAMLEPALPCARSAMPHSTATPKVLIEDPKLRRAINDIARLIGDSLVTKYSNAREALRHLDLTNDGWVTRLEMKRLCRSMNLYGSEADVLFDALGGSNAEQIALDAFIAMLQSVSGVATARSAAPRGGDFCGDRWRAVAELRDLPRPGFSHT